jgi:hypothetical protein
MASLLTYALHEIQRHKALAEQAMVALSEEQFFHRPASQVNSVAIIVKHLAGNLKSRWTDFLTTDGEKPQRDRDGEFIITSGDSRESLMAAWDGGWRIMADAISALSPGDLDKCVTIRKERHTVEQALLRSLMHAAYHVGQILYVVRWLRPESRWLTIEPGKSREHVGSYTQQSPSATDQR